MNKVHHIKLIISRIKILTGKSQPMVEVKSQSIFFFFLVNIKYNKFFFEYQRYVVQVTSDNVTSSFVSTIFLFKLCLFINFLKGCCRIIVCEHDCATKEGVSFVIFIYLWIILISFRYIISVRAVNSIGTSANSSTATIRIPGIFLKKN